jgi:hypothetical protein
MAEAIGLVQVLTLPQSKYKVRARRPSLITLIASGGFPAELAAVVWRMYEKGEDADTATTEPDNIMRMASLIEAYVPHVLVTPQVGPTSQIEIDAEGFVVGTISMIDLHDTDKRFLFFYGQGLLEASDLKPTETASAPALASFPENVARADARPAREPVRTETVDAPGDVPAEPAGAGL